MKKTRLIISILFITCLGLFSFYGNTEVKSKLLGIWIQSGRTVDVTAYRQAKKFAEGDGGMEFMPDGKLIVRQNAGWCGTPPIEYANYDGTWKLDHDSLLVLAYKYWGSQVKEKARIELIVGDKLILKSLEVERQQTK